MILVRNKRNKYLHYWTNGTWSWIPLRYKSLTQEIEQYLIMNFITNNTNYYRVYSKVGYYKLTNNKGLLLRARKI